MTLDEAFMSALWERFPCLTSRVRLWIGPRLSYLFGNSTVLRVYLDGELLSELELTPRELAVDGFSVKLERWFAELVPALQDANDGWPDCLPPMFADAVGFYEVAELSCQLVHLGVPSTEWDHPPSSGREEEPLREPWGPAR